MSLLVMPLNLFRLLAVRFLKHAHDPTTSQFTNLHKSGCVPKSLDEQNFTARDGHNLAPNFLQSRFFHANYIPSEPKFLLLSKHLLSFHTLRALLIPAPPASPFFIYKMTLSTLSIRDIPFSLQNSV